jgi:hypothetical protein
MSARRYLVHERGAAFAACGLFVDDVYEAPVGGGALHPVAGPTEREVAVAVADGSGVCRVVESG